MKTVSLLLVLLASVAVAAEPKAKPVDLINPKVGMKGKLPADFKRVADVYPDDTIQGLYSIPKPNSGGDIICGPPLFFRGFIVDPLVDSDFFDPDVEVEVVATERYVTFLGERRTAYVIRPLKKR